MEKPDINAITTDKLALPWLLDKGIEISVLRLDKVHKIISGNKWFKLKYYLEDYSIKSYQGILTFGGAYSNHIVAAACAGYLNNIKTIGVIRGEKAPELSHTLRQAEALGMQFEFVSRDIYQNYSRLPAGMQRKFPQFYFIPEGGAGEPGEKGCGEILLHAPEKEIYTHIACAIGTGTMFTGLANGSLLHQEMMGISVLKGMKGMLEKYRGRFNDPGKTNHCRIFYEYHFGGYAKYNPALFSFMNDFYQSTGIPTDFVYTGKLLSAILDLAERNYFQADSKILIIHSGGLQGNESLAAGTLIF